MNDCPRSRWITRLAASMVAASLLITPALAEAAPSPLHSESKQLPRASKSGFTAGHKAHKAGDFARAGDEWSAVLAGMPEGAQTQGPRMRLVVDTIGSYRAAFASDGSITHLEAGMDTYYAYFAAYKQTYGTPAIPRLVVEARHALKAELDQARRDDRDKGAAVAVVATDENSSTTQPADDPSASTGGSDAGGSDAGINVAVSTQSDSTDHPGRPLIIAGAVVMSVGIGASSLIIVGAIEGKDAREAQKSPGYDDEQRVNIDKRGKSMNALFIAGLIATPVLVGAGAAMIVVGAKRRNNPVLQASVTPMLKRGVAGVSVSGRF